MEGVDPTSPRPQGRPLCYCGVWRRLENAESGCTSHGEDLRAQQCPVAQAPGKLGVYLEAQMSEALGMRSLASQGGAR